MNKQVLFICTVGGSPEPIVASIKHARPSRLLFLASPETRDVTPAQILPLLRQEGIELSSGQYEVVELPDAQVFDRCVHRLRAIDGDVRRWLQRGQDYGVVVDFTGGTKCMSAALTLHARRWPCEFYYVGGTDRQKDGVGIVISGKEQVLHTQNPWESLGFQAVEEFLNLFNETAYASARRLSEDAVRRISDPSRKSEFGALIQLAEAYEYWDRFDHKGAFERIKKLHRCQNDLRAALGNAPLSQQLLETLRAHQVMLEKLVAGDLDAIVRDLLANARRRRGERRWDDAVARLYRAIEALAQARLKSAHQIPDTKQIPVDQLPQSLRDGWKNRSRQGLIMAGLQDAYAILRELGDPVGARFENLGLQSRESPLSSRNDSILAHGFRPVGEKVCDQLWQITLKLAECDEEQLCQFPKLRPVEVPT